MSYGKQEGHLQHIGSYGATRTQQMGNAMRRQSGPRRGSPSWANNFNPTETGVDLIRLIPGQFVADRVDSSTGQEYQETVDWKEHTVHYYNAQKKSIICSGGVHRMGDWSKSQPCRGCDWWREDFKERKRIEQEVGRKPTTPNRVSFSNRYGFYVLDMGWFFKGPRLDKNGRPRLNDQNQPYMDWVKYNPNDPRLYNQVALDAQRQGKQLEMRQGLVQTWPVGHDFFMVLNGQADMVQMHCKGCGGMNSIITQTWICPHCNAPTLQPEQSTMPLEKVRELVQQVITCYHCHNKAYPRPIYGCMRCPNPQPASLYDVDLQVRQIKAEKSSQLLIPWMSQPKPIEAAFNEAISKLPDMEKKFAPTPFDEQCTIFGHPAPAPAPQEQQAPAPNNFGYQQSPYGQPAPYGYQQQQPAPAPAYGYQQPQQPPQYQQPAPPPGHYPAPYGAYGYTG